MRFFAVLLLLSGSVLAQESVVVKAVLDGDSFQDSAGRTIHLLGIKAPTGSEAHAKQARDYLTLLLLDRQVQLYNLKTDLSGDLYAKVGWRKWDVNMGMVSRGLARVVSTELDEKTLSNYNVRQSAAKQKRVGIWSGGSSLLAPIAHLEPYRGDLKPIPPPKEKETVIYSEPVYRYTAPVRQQSPLISSPVFMGFGSYGGGAACVGSS